MSICNSVNVSFLVFVLCLNSLDDLAYLLGGALCLLISVNIPPGANVVCDRFGLWR